MARILHAILLSSILLAASAATGQTDSPDFNAWWARVTSGGANGPSLDGVSLKYVREQVFIPPADELAALRARVANKPIHPERFALEAYERRLKSGKPDTSEHQVWRYGSEWRLSKSYSIEDLSYWDFAFGPDGAWHLTPQKLTVVPALGESQVGREIAAQSSGMTLETCLLVTGGLVNAGALKVVLQPRLVGADRWVAEATKSDESGTIVMRAEGGWDAQVLAGTVRRCEVRISTPGQPENAELYNSEGWEYQPRLRLYVAGVVVQLDARGIPQTRFRRVLLEEFEKARFDELVRVPRLDAPDPVRGRLSVTSISDSRPGTAATWERQGASLSEVEVASQSRLVTWRVAGWLLAGLLLITLVLLRMHARRVQSPEATARKPAS